MLYEVVIYINYHHKMGSKKEETKHFLLMSPPVLTHYLETGIKRLVNSIEFCSSVIYNYVPER
jgi:hypothetical protein